jgi:hypothetical protein
MKHRAFALLGPLLAAAALSPLAAQSARPWSVQASGLFAALLGEAYDNLKSGLGVEVQLRRTFGRGSVGAGIEFTEHKLELLTDANPVGRIGPFVEPRLVILTASNTVAPYLSARIALLKISYRDKATDILQSATGYTLNGGGGMLVRLAPRLNLDLGATFGHTRFGNLTSSGAGGPTTALGSGSNLILRTGFTLGL